MKCIEKTFMIQVQLGELQGHTREVAGSWSGSVGVLNTDN